MIGSYRAGAVVSRGLVAAMVLMAAGCGKEPPPPPPPTLVNVKISATAKVNAAADGTGEPISVRVYQLGSATVFDSQEFFPIYKTDAAALGADLIKKDEFLLAPGKEKTLQLKPTDAVHAIGIFAAYSDFQHVKWRASADVPAHKTTEMGVTLDRPGMKLSGVPDTAAGP